MCFGDFSMEKRDANVEQIKEFFKRSYPAYSEIFLFLIFENLNKMFQNYLFNLFEII